MIWERTASRGAAGPRNGVAFSNLKLTADGLSCVRGDRLVLNGVSFTCDAHSPLIVKGPNGAGKSTLLRVVAGLVAKASGDVQMSGDGFGGASAMEAEQIHYVGHSDGVKPVLTVRENVAFWAAFLGRAGSHHVQNALQTFDLESVADLPAQFLSAGQKRRVALARLIASARALWLLDEPTAALDQSSAAKLADVRAAHCQSGGLLMIATHDDLKVPGAQILELSSSAGRQ